MALGFVYLVLVLLIMTSNYTASFATADSAKDRGMYTAVSRDGHVSALRWRSSQGSYTSLLHCSQTSGNNNKRCLCVIIKNRNDPALSLQMNVTLALGLPAVCKAPLMSPKLLHLDPKSPEAQVFYQLEGNSTKTANNLAPSTTKMVVVRDSSWGFPLMVFYLFI
ncbi:protein YLS3-like [Pyrus ussuriensis x Pyrus communis]|uniref:Protein YLS3-like n=1 Tax=Pyrus ussuriensis x Pyrus communis TaxID=2448454 RepID=A0A5N5HLS7_9ROSA|nr:protein YLS3-like [Pyrus ussuriensis x Pyrus communis]